MSLTELGNRPDAIAQGTASASLPPADGVTVTIDAALLNRQGSAADPAVSLVVHVVFVFSGIAALLYQLVWQRSLMVIYGSNVESVAMVVSAFLVGLGLGSLVGGQVSKRRGVPLVLLFSASELLIGLYGLFSLRLIRWVGGITLYAGTLETGLLAFALVFLPTLFMGATLPLLVAYRVNSTGQVGRSVSWLYFVNTLGGGLGAFVGAFVILGACGLSGSTKWAALLNLVSALAVLAIWKLRRNPT
jgi:spermidine synthase